MASKLLAKKQKGTGNPNTESENMQLRCRNGIWHRKMRHVCIKSGKRHMTEGIEQPNLEKSQRSEKRKPKKTWKYWKLTPSNK